MMWTRPLPLLGLQGDDLPAPGGEAPPDAALPEDASLLERGWAMIEQERWLQAVAILFAAFCLAKVADWLLTSTIRVLTRRTKSEVDDAIIDALHKPIMKTVVLVGAFFALGRLATDDDPLVWAKRLCWTLGIFVWLGTGLRLTGLVLRAMSGSDRKFLAVETRTLPLFDNLAKVLIVGLAGYLIFQVWELDPAAWLASAGVAGIAIGFAAKDTLANLFSGVFIIADAPYQIGDYVLLDSGHRGKVLHIGLRSTKILTRDDVQITVPNSIIGNGAIINETSGTPQYRLKVLVGVAYGSDIDRVKEVLQEVGETCGVLLADPEPRVRFRAFGASSLDLELQGWITDPAMRGRTLDALNTAVYKRFAQEEIEIAFPQQDVHVRMVATDDD